MILRLSHDLMFAMLEGNYPIHPMEDLSHLRPLIPQWLLDMAEEAAGSAIIIVSQEEYDEVPPEARREMEVMAR